MADWGDFIFETAQQWVGQQLMPATGTAVSVPRTVGDVIGTTGPPILRPTRIGRCRKRRRRLLTPTDLADLAALKTITGNNDALKYAVMKAVRK